MDASRRAWFMIGVFVAVIVLDLAAIILMNAV